MTSQLARPSWQFALTDPAGALLAPLNAVERQLSFGLTAIDQFAFKVRLDDRYADLLFDVDKVVVKGYQSEQAGPALRFQGPLVTVREASDARGGAALACVAQGMPWRLTRRLIA